VAGTLAFEPELLARARVECGETAFDGLSKRLLIHKTNHEDTAGGVILDHGGDQSIGFLKVKIHVEHKKKKPAVFDGGRYFEFRCESKSEHRPSH
jgi:hypothetical protein